jgi:cytochrome o ubiquinol oxidase operon protein cyoD
MSETNTEIVVEQHEAAHGSLLSYTIGFILSIGLTIWAYVSVKYQSFSGKALLAWLLGLAVVQFVVQLLFFLHVGSESKPRWRRLTIVLMLVFVLIVVLGSIWIMYNLNYRMSPEQMNQYMTKESNSGF